MKKQLLFSASLLVSGLLCAQVAKKAQVKIPANLANKSAVKITKNLNDNNSTNYSNVSTVAPKPVVVKNNSKTSAMTETTIGGTYYDLQSNSSVGDRIVVNADGSIATVWTIEPTDVTQSFANRGTGYAYFDGATWSAPPTARIENAKVGWGNIVNTRSGRELVLSHNGGAAKLHLATRAVKGTGAWNNSTTTVPTATTGGNFWPRMVNSGDTVYAISLTYPVGSGGAMYQGLDGAVVFSRSLDQGVTWDIVNVVPTGLTSVDFRGFSGDGYAIASRGATVAIVAGDADKDVVMTKSTDGGVTWSSTVVMDCPITKWDHTTTTSDYNGDAVADTLETNDGTFSIGLDNFGSAYVFFGSMRILQDAVATTQTYSYFPGTDGLYMWRESYGASVFPTQTPVIIAAIEDLYQQGTIYFPTPSDPAQSPWGTFGCSLTSYPSVAFDAFNTMFLSYSSIVDSLQSIASSSEKLVRHQYLIQSCDGGDNWSTPYDVVGAQGGVPYEGVYGSLAKNVDGNLHLIYQKDLYAGFGVNATDDADNQGNWNDIVYVKVPTADLPLPSLTLCAVGVKDLTSTVSGLNFYPNPASSNGTIEVVLNDNAKMDIVIINNVGQTVYSTSVAGNSGSNKIDVNLSNLASGLYFYQVKIGNSQAVTKKFAVGK